MCHKTILKVIIFCLGVLVSQQCPAFVSNADFESGFHDEHATDWDDFDGTGPGTRSVYFRPGEGGYVTNPGINSGRAASLKSNSGAYVQHDLEALLVDDCNWCRIDFSLGYRNDAATSGDIPFRVALWDVTNDVEIAGRDIIIPDPGYTTPGQSNAVWTLQSITLETDVTGMPYGEVALRFTNNKLLSSSWRATAVVDNVTVTVNQKQRASAVYPLSQAVDVTVDTNPTLEWNQADDVGITNHVLYFSSDLNWVASAEPNDPRAVTLPLAVLKYQHSAELAGGRTYYWRVDQSKGDANDPANVVGGYIWRFTTLLPPCSNYNNDGDADGDCAIGMADLRIVAEAWLTSGTDIPGDLDTSITVDLNDFAFLGRDWRRSLLSAVRRNVIVWAGAHPDDELWGAGCAFARYCADQKQRCIFLQVTKGEGSSCCSETGYALGEIRAGEIRASASGFNSDIRFLGIWNGEAQNDYSIMLKRATRLIREIQPDVLITHGPEGEYGHFEHVAVSSAITEAFHLAPIADAYPDQLAEGLTTWQVQKFYRVVELNNTDTITLVVPGDDYSDRLGDTYGEYSDRIIRQSHQSQSGLLSNETYWPRHWTNLSRIYPTPSGTEGTVLDGLTYNVERPACIRNWLICGSFTSAGIDPLDADFLVWNSGEEGTIPVAGMDTAGRIWTELNSERDYVDFRDIYDPVNYDAVAYAYATIHSYARTEHRKLRVSSHDGVKVWLNGVLVHENRTAREYDYEDIIDVTLEGGDNHLLIKVKAGSRFSDPDDGLIVRPWGFFAR